MVTPALDGDRSTVTRHEGNLMKPTRHSQASRGAAAAACAALLLVASGCGRGDQGAPDRLAAARQAVEQCSGTDTHTKHINRFACETCHPKGGEFRFSGTLPSGTAVTGTVTRVAGVPPSCTVTCHGPEGSPQPVAWDAGALACGACHPGAVLVAGGSAHAPGGDRATCEGCHDLGQHMSGLVRLVNGMQPGTEAMCLTCHSGTGGTLADAPGILLVGWQDVAGDWHGGRAGTGSSGTLRQPYVRGASPLPCTACHDEHASPNAFMLAPVVNGTAIPAGTIGRGGTGAEAFCEACHEGPRHAGCAGCHAADPVANGKPCFFCHGHEGLVNFRGYAVAVHGTGGQYEGECAHCHETGWSAVPFESTPPALRLPPIVTNITTTGATIMFGQTDRDARGWIEWGVAKAGYVSGWTMSSGTDNQVQLTGLVPATTYVYRVAARDEWRNAARSPLYTFTTLAAGVPPAPAPGSPGSPDWWAEPITIVLPWSPVTDPDGDPVQYRVQVDDDPAFGSVNADSGWIAATQHTIQLPNCAFYYWRVKARDALDAGESSWAPGESLNLDCGAY